MSRKILGLDIGSDTVAAVMIESSLRENRIVNTGVVSLPDAANLADGLGSALTELNGRMPLTGAVCAVSFPANQFFFRNVRIPFRNAKKIEQVLGFEMEPVLPVPPDDLITDFHMVRVAGEQTDIAAMSIAKSEMKVWVDTLSGFGLDPKTVMPGTYPAALCERGTGKMAENRIMVDAGEKNVTVFLVLSGTVHVMRNFPLHGHGEREKQVQSIIEQTVLGFEDMFSLRFEPEQILVIGNTGNGKMVQELETLTGIPAAYADVLGNSGDRLRLSPGTEWKIGQMDNALALALAELEGKKGLNFRKGTFAARKEWEVHKRNLIGAAVFSGVIFFLWVGNQMTDSLILQSRIDRIDTRIAGIFKSVFPEVQRVVNPVHQMQTGLDDLRKSAPLPADGAGNLRIADMLYEISARIPKEIDVEFSRLVIDPDGILISGDTDTFNSVDSIQTALSGSAFFKKVTISSTSKDQKASRVNFRIKVDL